MNKYPVYEHFHSWQGEGVYSGQSAYFIRLYGCPLRCEWCDSAGTWHKNWKPKNIPEMTSEEIFNLFCNKNVNFVVITGGEPSIYDLTDLTSKINIPIHIETCGAFELKGKFDWITVSPKFNKLPLYKNIELANEIKIVVENEETIGKWISMFPSFMTKQSVFCIPEWSQRNNKNVLNSINNAVKNLNFKAGFQLHKIFDVDKLDENCKPLIPLGGNIESGY